MRGRRRTRDESERKIICGGVCAVSRRSVSAFFDGSDYQGTKAGDLPDLDCRRHDERRVLWQL